MKTRWYWSHLSKRKSKEHSVNMMIFLSPRRLFMKPQEAESVNESSSNIPDELKRVTTDIQVSGEWLRFLRLGIHLRNVLARLAYWTYLGFICWSGREALTHFIATALNQWKGNLQPASRTNWPKPSTPLSAPWELKISESKTPEETFLSFLDWAESIRGV